MSKHTKGPWNTWQLNRHTVVAQRGGAIGIADCESEWISDGEGAANAKLIAASPELLEVLENLAEYCQNEYEMGRLSGAAIRSILEESGRVVAKAKGKLNVEKGGE